ncbi:MAG: LuxR C-terminal-related transcriptional regulator [Massilia sp.]
MQAAVILSKLEQEYLLRAIEAGVRVRALGQLFLWTQGQVQALLPHQLMACLQFGEGGVLRRLDCLHGAVLEAGVRAMLADPADGLALALARRWQGSPAAPLVADAADPGLGLLAGRLRAAGFDNALVHGSAGEGGATVFALFGLPMRPGLRQGYFLELLLPYLHMALARLPAGAGQDERGGLPARALSAREAEIVDWLREGKSNGEIGCLLGISGLTVKNHLQRIYRALGVANRAHALARCMELRLLDGRPARR